MRFALSAIAALLITSLSAAHAQVQLDSVAEVIRPEQLVSGRGFVGAVAANAGAAVDLKDLEILVPAGADGRLKIQVISSGAQYLGTIIGALKGVVPGWTGLNIRSKFPDALDKYTTDSVALLAELDDKVILTRWKSASDTVFIYVNSEKSDASVAWRNKEGKVELSPCRRLSGDLIRFDTICTAPMSMIGDEALRIIRRRSGAVLDPIQVQLSVK